MFLLSLCLLSLGSAGAVPDSVADDESDGPGKLVEREKPDATPQSSGGETKPAEPLPAAGASSTSSRTQEPYPRDEDDLRQIEAFRELIVQQKFQEVEPRLLAYLAEHPNSWQAYYFLGYVQFRHRRLADSIKTMAKSLELNVNNVEAHKILGRCFTIIGRFSLAKKEFDLALRLKPDYAEIHYNLGRVYAAEDDFPRARGEFAIALRIDPTYMQAYNVMGFTMEALGDDDAALENYENAIRLNEYRNGKFDAPYVNMSGFYNRRGKLDRALEYARKALELNPKSDLAYFQIAKAYRATEDWAKVAEALEKAIEIKPYSSQYFYILSTAYRKLGKRKEGMQALKTFQKLERETAAAEAEIRRVRRGSFDLESRAVE